MQFWTRSWARRASLDVDLERRYDRRARPAPSLARGAALALCAIFAAGTAGADSHEATTPTARPTLTLETLMERLAATSGVKTRFFEEKHLALLVEPLETEGVLYFAAPDKLARMTERPAPATLVINGDQLVQSDSTGVDRMDLGESDVARQFVENFIVLFNGDLESMLARYEVEFSSEGAGWRIRLEPRSRVVGRMIDFIVLVGEDALLRRMEIQETSGDRSVTRFDETVPDYAFSLEELARLFAVVRGSGTP